MGTKVGLVLKILCKFQMGQLQDQELRRLRKQQRLVQSTWDEASKSPTIKVGLKEGEPILIHLIQVVENMTQGSLDLLLFKAFNLLKNLFYQFRISGLQGGLVLRPKLLQPNYCCVALFTQKYFWEKRVLVWLGF